ncbi:unnamed protein product [Durusdinium trenchii]|uniref:Uncharacterized protein n=2 Tax=Durusdinium trenchii TaxID=1381693 RepID=A0ABP0K2B6_9DINO
MDQGFEDSEEEEDNEDFLRALENSLCDHKYGSAGSEVEAYQAHGELVRWPLEVRLGVASFLLWSELVAYSLLCRAWRLLELEDTLWQVYFSTTWPRLAQRWEAIFGDFSQPWRVLFRAQWARGNHTEDALEEDWLDFNAVQKLKPPPDALSTFESNLQQAICDCRKDLFQQGLRVPIQADAQHTCNSNCRLHRLNFENGDMFLCEASGNLHQCLQNIPCAGCVASPDDCFLVCPVSGRCFPKSSTVNEEGPDTRHEWDPELSAAQQVGRWFEQGYFMSDEQAAASFGGRRSKRHCSGIRVGAFGTREDQSSPPLRSKVTETSK